MTTGSCIRNRALDIEFAEAILSAQHVAHVDSRIYISFPGAPANITPLPRLSYFWSLFANV